MFGYVVPDLSTLSPQGQERYRGVYCGLCRALERRYGQAGRMALTYDMTFLTLLLSSLYEPEETTQQRTCLRHIGRKHMEVISPASDYAADMTIALTWHKCMDDWRDDRNLPKKAYADMLRPAYNRVKTLWPKQCQTIERCMETLTEIEKHPDAAPDEAMNCFGELMASLFLWREDFWQQALQRFGMSLGRFIYLLDALMDYDHDMKKGSYNPLRVLGGPMAQPRQTLMAVLGDASQVLEELPLVQDIGLLRNILYSGVWSALNERERKEGAANGDGSVSDTGRQQGSDV